MTPDMPLHLRQYGDGATQVLGLHCALASGRVLQGLAAALPDSTWHVPDLPGHAWCTSLLTIPVLTRREGGLPDFACLMPSCLATMQLQQACLTERIRHGQLVELSLYFLFIYLSVFALSLLLICLITYISFHNPFRFSENQIVVFSQLLIVVVHITLRKKLDRN